MFSLTRILYCLSLCSYVLSGTKEAYKKETWDKGKLHEEKVHKKTKRMDNQLKESDVRASSRTVRAPCRTSGTLARPSEQLRSRRPEDLTAMSYYPETTPDHPASSRTVRLTTTDISSIFCIGRTVRVTGRTVRPEAGPSELQVGPSDLPDACAQN